MSWDILKLSSLDTKPVERTDCPLCGTKLDKKDRTLHCPFDGWTAQV